MLSRLDTIGLLERDGRTDGHNYKSVSRVSIAVPTRDKTADDCFSEFEKSQKKPKQIGRGVRIMGTAGALPSTAVHSVYKPLWTLARLA